MNAPTTPDPIEIAMTAEADGAPPSGVAARVLEKQERLIGWQIASERAGFGLKVLMGLAGVAAAAALAAMAWTASQDESLVIDPIGAPADLVQQGATGPALAHRLQDRLVAMQAETRTQIASAQVRERAASDLKVQIPATGISLSDLDQALRQWLGRQTHLTAEVSRVVSGPERGALALTARVAGRPGVRIVQPDGDLDALLGRAAEYVYGAAEPLRYADWLDGQGRRDEALLVVQAETRAGSDMHRAEAYNRLGYLLEVSVPVSRRIPLLDEALRLSGGRIGRNDRGSAENALGHDEAAYQAYRALQKQPAQTGVALTPQARELRRVLADGNVGVALSDYRGWLAVSCLSANVAPCTGADLLRAVQADPTLMERGRIANGAAALVWSYDTGATAALLAFHRMPDLATISARAGTSELNWISLRAALANRLEDWPGVLAAARDHDILVTRWPGLDTPYSSAVRYRPVALAMTGDLAGAERAAAAQPVDCYKCVVTRALVALQKGDRATADRWFAEAARQGPSLAYAESEWAKALLAQGRFDEAIAKASVANQRSPGFGDPLVFWGEALTAKGDAKAAISKFEAAAKLVPNWPRLHVAWGQALARLGRAEDARAHWRKAAALDGAPSDRARAQALLAGRPA